MSETPSVAHLTPLAAELLREPPARRSRAILEERWVLYPRAKHTLGALNRLVAHPRTTRMPSVGPRPAPSGHRGSVEGKVRRPCTWRRSPWRRSCRKQHPRLHRLPVRPRPDWLPWPSRARVAQPKGQVSKCVATAFLSPFEPIFGYAGPIRLSSTRWRRPCNGNRTLLHTHQATAVSYFAHCGPMLCQKSTFSAAATSCELQ